MSTVHTNLGTAYTITIDNTWVRLHVAEYGTIIVNTYGRLHVTDREILYSDPEFGNVIRQYMQRWIEIQRR